MALVNDVHTLNSFGAVQFCELPHTVHLKKRTRPFDAIHTLCATTPCNLANFVADPYFCGDERSFINQTHDQTSPICLTKTPDGLVFHIQSRLISGMFGKSLYEQESTEPLKVFVVADKGPAFNKPFVLVHHTSPCNPHELSRHSITQHILSQILAVRPPCSQGTPRVLFEAPNLGTFSSRLLVGPEVHELKSSFLKLIATMSQRGTGVYDKTIKLKPEYSKLLMLKFAGGNIRCDRCHDGIVGYRVRPHNQKKSFVFVVNSNDFHAHELAEPESSMLQVLKMDYADTSKKGARIVVRTEDTQAEEDDTDDEEEEEPGEEAEEGSQEDPSCIHLNMSVQEIINQIELAFRHKLLEHHECHMFPTYCTMLDRKQQKKQPGHGYKLLGG